MGRTRRTFLLASALPLAPGVASASVVTGSRLNYVTDFRVYETPRDQRCSGASTGTVKLCADQAGAGPSSPSIGGSIAEIWREIPYAPDSKVRALLVLSGGGAPIACTKLAATSTQQIYDTKVYASLSPAPGDTYFSGWARGEDR